MGKHNFMIVNAVWTLRKLCCSLLGLAAILIVISWWVVRAGFYGAQLDENITVNEPDDVKILTSTKIVQQPTIVTKVPEDSTKSEVKRKKVELPWGLRRIICSYRDLVYFTIVREGQFRELRDLVGSIHRWRPLTSQSTPVIYIYGYRLRKREIDEISLWRNVIFQDLKTVLTPYMIFDGVQGLNKSVELVTTIDPIIFTAEGPRSIKSYLMSRVVQLHGHAIYVRIGSVFWGNTFKKLLEELKQVNYFSLKSCFGEVVVESFVDGTEAFRCGIQATWNPWLSRDCTNWTLVQNSSIEYQIDETAPPDDEENLNVCHICFRDDAHHGWHFFQDKRKELSPTPMTELKKVAIGFPTTSRSVKEFWDLPFLMMFLPTISSSLDLEGDLHQYELSFYIGYDEGDRVYDNRELLRRIIGKARSTFADLGAPNVKFTFVRLGVSGAVTYIWNVLFSMSMADGADYYYQVNDDLRFTSFGWLQTFVGQLDRQGGFGVVGPNDPAFNCKIMTQTMVSRLHWEIFGWFFPPEFRNWQCDTWVSLVYSKYTRCFMKMQIWNGRYSSDGGYLPRYQPCRKAEFKPLTLHYQKRLKNAQGSIDPTLFTKGQSGVDDDSG